MRLLQFIAVILTALVFAPTGAHLFELPNKIILPKEQYFIVQSVYRGWALFGIVIIGAIAANLVAAWRCGAAADGFGPASRQPSF